MIRINTKRIKLAGTATIAGLACILTLQSFPLLANDTEPVIVNVDNYVRAETAARLDRMLMTPGAEINKIVHNRNPIALDAQSVIRMNRDTLYSAVIIDISKGATLTVPDMGDRYMSFAVTNENHYINKIYDTAGIYNLTMQEFHTPYVLVTIRTLMNATDPADIKEANALQDQVEINVSSAIPYTHPSYDKATYKATYKTLIELSRGITDMKNMFGKKEEVSEVRHLIGSAFAWGGLPEQEAYYIKVEPNLPVGAYQLTVKDVPVDAFWSISVYNKDGYFQENEYAAYSVNNIASTPNEDGSFTIRFGGDPKSANYLHITEGWNYLIRFYRPRKEILEETWNFPSVTPVE